MGIGGAFKTFTTGGLNMLGGLLGKQGPETIETRTTLPSWLSQGGQDYFTRAQSLSNRPFQAFDPNSQRSWSPDQTNAINRMRSLLNSYSGAGENAMQTYQSTLRGDFLDPAKNPAWGALSGRISDQYNTTVRPQTDAAFARANAFGGGNSAYDQTVALNNRSLADSLSNLAGGMYQQERGRQDQAMYSGPQAFQSLLSPSQGLFDIGNLQYQDFLMERDAPIQNLGILGNAFQTLAPSYAGQSQTNPNQRSGIMDLLGIGALGLGAFKGFGGSAAPAAAGGFSAIPQSNQSFSSILNSWR